MRITGIVLLVIGTLCLLQAVISLFFFDADGNVPFLGNSWAPVLASFCIPGGIALMVAGKKRKKTTQVKH